MQAKNIYLLKKIDGIIIMYDINIAVLGKPKKLKREPKVIFLSLPHFLLLSSRILYSFLPFFQSHLSFLALFSWILILHWISYHECLRNLESVIHLSSILYLSKLTHLVFKSFGFDYYLNDCKNVLQVGNLSPEL